MEDSDELPIVMINLLDGQLHTTIEELRKAVKKVVAENLALRREKTSREPPHRAHKIGTYRLQEKPDPKSTCRQQSDRTEDSPEVEGIATYDASCGCIKLEGLTSALENYNQKGEKFDSKSSFEKILSEKSPPVHDASKQQSVDKRPSLNDGHNWDVKTELLDHKFREASIDNSSEESVEQPVSQSHNVSDEICRDEETKTPCVVCFENASDEILSDEEELENNSQNQHCDVFGVVKKTSDEAETTDNENSQSVINYSSQGIENIANETNNETSNNLVQNMEHENDEREASTEEDIVDDAEDHNISRNQNSTKDSLRSHGTGCSDPEFRERENVDLSQPNRMTGTYILVEEYDAEDHKISMNQNSTNIALGSNGTDSSNPELRERENKDLSQPNSKAETYILYEEYNLDIATAEGDDIRCPSQYSSCDTFIVPTVESSIDGKQEDNKLVDYEQCYSESEVGAPLTIVEELPGTPNLDASEDMKEDCSTQLSERDEYKNRQSAKNTPPDSINSALIEIPNRKEVPECKQGTGNCSIPKLVKNSSHQSLSLCDVNIKEVVKSHHEEDTSNNLEQFMTAEHSDIENAANDDDHSLSIEDKQAVPNMEEGELDYCGQEILREDSLPDDNDSCKIETSDVHMRATNLGYCAPKEILKDIPDSNDGRISCMKAPPTNKALDEEMSFEKYLILQCLQSVDRDSLHGNENILSKRCDEDISSSTETALLACEPEVCRENFNEPSVASISQSKENAGYENEQTYADSKAMQFQDTYAKTTCANYHVHVDSKEIEESMDLALPEQTCITETKCQGQPLSPQLYTNLESTSDDTGVEDLNNTEGKRNDHTQHDQTKMDSSLTITELRQDIEHIPKTEQLGVLKLDCLPNSDKGARPKVKEKANINKMKKTLNTDIMPNAVNGRRGKIKELKHIHEKPRPQKKDHLPHDNNATKTKGKERASIHGMLPLKHNTIPNATKGANDRLGVKSCMHEYQKDTDSLHDANFETKAKIKDKPPIQIGPLKTESLPDADNRTRHKMKEQTCMNEQLENPERDSPSYEAKANTTDKSCLRGNQKLVKNDMFYHPRAKIKEQMAFDGQFQIAKTKDGNRYRPGTMTNSSMPYQLSQETFAKEAVDKDDTIHNRFDTRTSCQVDDKPVSPQSVKGVDIKLVIKDGDFKKKMHIHSDGKPTGLQIGDKNQLLINSDDQALDWDIISHGINQQEMTDCVTSQFAFNSKEKSLDFRDYLHMRIGGTPQFVDTCLLNYAELQQEMMSNGVTPQVVDGFDTARESQDMLDQQEDLTDGITPQLVDGFDSGIASQADLQQEMVPNGTTPQFINGFDSRIASQADLQEMVPNGTTPQFVDGFDGEGACMDTIEMDGGNDTCNQMGSLSVVLLYLLRHFKKGSITGWLMVMMDRAGVWTRYHSDKKSTQIRKPNIRFDHDSDSVHVNLRQCFPDNTGASLYIQSGVDNRFGMTSNLLKNLTGRSWFIPWPKMADFPHSAIPDPKISYPHMFSPTASLHQVPWKNDDYLRLKIKFNMTLIHALYEAAKMKAVTQIVNMHKANSSNSCALFGNHDIQERQCTLFEQTSTDGRTVQTHSHAAPVQTHSHAAPVQTASHLVDDVCTGAEFESNDDGNYNDDMIDHHDDDNDDVIVDADGHFIDNYDNHDDNDDDDDLHHHYHNHYDNYGDGNDGNDFNFEVDTDIAGFHCIKDRLPPPVVTDCADSYVRSTICNGRSPLHVVRKAEESDSSSNIEALAASIHHDLLDRANKLVIQRLITSESFNDFLRFLNVEVSRINDSGVICLRSDNLHKVIVKLCDIEQFVQELIFVILQGLEISEGVYINQIEDVELCRTDST